MASSEWQIGPSVLFGTRHSLFAILLASERVPGRRRRELEIADIGAEPEADAGTDWNHHHIIRRQRRHSEPADEIGRTVDADETLVDRFGGRQAVDQHHGAGALAAEIETDRRTLPEDPQVAGILGIERAFAIAQPRDYGAAGLLAEDVAVGQAPLAPRLLDDLGEPARDRA